MPNEVEQKRNTRAAADARAGARAGSVTVHQARIRPAPITLAAIAELSSSRAQKLPTVRATTATFGNTRASTSTVSVRSRPSHSSGPAGPNSAEKATPTTTVGSTKGTVMSPCSSVRPGKSSL